MEHFQLQVIDCYQLTQLLVAGLEIGPQKFWQGLNTNLTGSYYPPLLGVQNYYFLRLSGPMSRADIY